jgi:hypothetical protein
MDFEVHVMATEFGRKILATAALRFSGFFLDCRAQKKDSNETATKGGLNKVKSRIGTRDDLVAATCGQCAARRREGKAKM